MRSIIWVLLINSLFLTTTATGQNNVSKDILSTQDSIAHFYDAFFKELKANYLFTKEVNWPELQSDITQKALKHPSFQASLAETPALFDSINGSHTILFAGEHTYNSNLNKQLTQADFTRNFLEHYEGSPDYEVKLIDQNYGYIFIPGMLMLNAKKPEMDQRVQEIYDAIVALDKQHEIKGWVIDLRMNIGGNANVMLAGLYHLIGDNTAYLTLDRHKEVYLWSGLHQGAFYQNHEKLMEAKIDEEPNTATPVALITGPMTASAGEYVVFGFRGRENVIIIGEESHGMTTCNDLFDLPYGTKAAITLGFGTDRSAQFTETIIPDIEIIRESNFQDLSKDKNVIEAIRFFNQQGATGSASK